MLGSLSQAQQDQVIRSLPKLTSGEKPVLVFVAEHHDCLHVKIQQKRS